MMPVKMNEWINMSRKRKRNKFKEDLKKEHLCNDKTSQGLFHFQTVKSMKIWSIDSTPHNICVLMLEMPHYPSAISREW